MHWYLYFLDILCIIIHRLSNIKFKKNQIIGLVTDTRCPYFRHSISQRTHKK